MHKTPIPSVYIDMLLHTPPKGPHPCIQSFNEKHILCTHTLVLFFSTHSHIHTHARGHTFLLFVMHLTVMHSVVLFGQNETQMC